MLEDAGHHGGKLGLEFLRTFLSVFTLGPILFALGLIPLIEAGDHAHHAKDWVWIE